MKHPTAGSDRPMARRQGLVVKELDGEVLIYDLERHEAHCLNDASARVWRACDGTKGLSELAADLQRSVTGCDEDTIRYALTQLEKRHLLAEPLHAGQVGRPLTRREMFRKAAVTGVAIGVGIPVVKSIVAPTPAHAASCLPTGSGCSSSAQCCSGLCVGGICL
jgi:Coenzyme PQQ synthesis protein D (PqqD)